MKEVNLHKYHEQFTARMGTDLSRKRDDHFKQWLREAGYNFQTEAEWIHFAKTRCRIEKHSDRRSILYADDKPIVEWWEEFDMQFNNKPDGTISLSATFMKARMLFKK